MDWNVQGVLEDGTILGVKKLFNSKQVLSEFLNEVVLITGIKHRNLIQLKGCCIKDRQRILVYEYAENRNVAEALRGAFLSYPTNLFWNCQTISFRKHL